MTASKPLVAARSAIRIDEKRRIREEARFFGPGERIFGVTHLPLRHIRAGVLICSPIKLEAMKNYRREVLLARRLAELGFAVQRFHYRGAGHSDGDGRESTFRMLVDDASLAMDLLIARTGVSVTASVGTRIGGLVAAAVAADRTGAPLVLWQPVTDASRYVGEVLRASRIANLKRPSGSVESGGPDPLLEIRESGSVDVLGFSIDAALCDSLQTVALENIIGSRPHPVMLIDVNLRKELRADYAALKDDLARNGFDVEATVIRHPDVGWWFVELGSHPLELDHAFVSNTTSWLQRAIH